MVRNIIIGIIVLIFLLIVGAIINSAMQPRPFTWYPSYDSYDKEPYGGFVIFTMLNDFFPGKKVKRLTNSDLAKYNEQFISNVYYDDDSVYFEYDGQDTAYYEYEEYDYEDYEEEIIIDETVAEEDTFNFEFRDSVHTKPFNLFFLSNAFSGQNEKIKAIFQHIHQGNDALIAARFIDENISSLLDISVKYHDLVSEESDSAKMAYSIEYKGQSTLKLKPQSYYSFFSHYPHETEIIAKNAYDQVVGLKIQLGEGTLTLFSLPIVFTNYYILKEDNQIAEELLTSLPLKDTYWSQNLYGAFGTNYPEKRSILSFIHSHESLKWAFYTLLFTLLIFFLFQIKRKQRVIPIVSPPENTSVKFLEVLGNLYLDKKDHKDMMIKKMNYFLMWVRDDLHLDTSNINKEFMTKLSHKTNVKLGIINLLFERYGRCIKQQYVSSEDFILVNKLFQDFKHKDNE